MIPRIGQGLDVHGFDDERPLVLGGVRISETGGLAGHSDADAVLHAVTDAILGASGEGDIGEYFPSSDARWAGANSADFVREALRRAASKGLAVGNIDITIVAQKPRLSPHRAQIRARVAELLGASIDQVNVKATTTDHLGFLGRGEGIAALAVVLLLPSERNGV